MGLQSLKFWEPRTRSNTAFIDALNQIKQSENPTPEEALKTCTKLVKAIRPARGSEKKQPEQRLIWLTNLIQKDERLRLKLKQTIEQLFYDTDLADVMVGCGLMDEGSFMNEIFRRIRHKLLPELISKGSLLYVINSIFYKSNDYKWVNEITSNTWARFFSLLSVEVSVADKDASTQLLSSLRILSSKVAVLGVTKSVASKLGQGKRYYNIFVRQEQLLFSICERMYASGEKRPESEHFATYLELLNECRVEIVRARRKALTQGVALKETHSFRRLEEMIERMELIVDILNGDAKIDLKRFVSYFKTVVEYENTKYKIGAYMGQTVEVMAYRITEHSQSTGEHYITTTKKQYKRMLISAAGGGVIISFTAILKNVIHLLKLAPFWQSFTYSVNYALGFIAIQLTGSTLATKQPAMTASTLCKSMRNKRYGDENMADLAITVSKVIRSQTASFIGNLAVVFPLTFGLAALYQLIFGTELASGAAAQELLDQQHPFRSLSLLYACFTGVFLFLSSIISGYFQNKVIYSKIPERIQNHPILRTILPERSLTRIAGYVKRNFGLLSGNISLGFFLGFASFFGYIFGIPFDIRHITISMGNFAIGLYGLGCEVAVSDAIITGIGVLLIGVLNFLISFSLAFYVAVRSRGIKLKQYPKFFKYLRRMIRKYPLDFFRAPKAFRTTADIMDKQHS